MNGIKIHLEAAEQDAVQRHAEALGVDCEDIAYAALNRLMLELKMHEKEIDHEIVNTRDWHHRDPPLWSDADTTHSHGIKSDDTSVTIDWFR